MEEDIFAFTPRNGLALHEKENMWRQEGLIPPGGPWESGVASSLRLAGIPAGQHCSLCCARSPWWWWSRRPRCRPHSSTYRTHSRPYVQPGHQAPRPPRGYVLPGHELTSFAPLPAYGA